MDEWISNTGNPPGITGGVTSIAWSGAALPEKNIADNGSKIHHRVSNKLIQAVYLVNEERNP
jgi:hypothetical protein